MSDRFEAPRRGRVRLAPQHRPWPRESAVARDHGYGGGLPIPVGRRRQAGGAGPCEAARCFLRTTRVPVDFSSGTLTTRTVLTQSPNPHARERINAQLAQIVEKPQKDCEDDSCYDGNDAEVVFANEQLQAIAGDHYRHGGAHPTNGNFA